MGPRCPRSQYVRSRFFITRCLLVVVASGVNYQGGLFILVYNYYYSFQINVSLGAKCNLYLFILSV